VQALHDLEEGAVLGASAAGVNLRSRASADHNAHGLRVRGAPPAIEGGAMVETLCAHVHISAALVLTVRRHIGRGMADIRQLTATLTVAPQIGVADVPGLAAAGFRAVINNRPDGESPGQPTNAAVEAAVRAHGLAYRFAPVVSGQISDADVAAFADAVRELPVPILAFCRSGTRCTVLWALAEAAQRTPEEIIAIAARAGYDLAALKPRLLASRGARALARP
jgi:sulfide:quinone oxidoreductase